MKFLEAGFDLRPAAAAGPLALPWGHAAASPLKLPAPAEAVSEGQQQWQQQQQAWQPFEQRRPAGAWQASAQQPNGRGTGPNHVQHQHQHQQQAAPAWSLPAKRRDAQPDLRQDSRLQRPGAPAMVAAAVPSGAKAAAGARAAGQAQFTASAAPAAGSPGAAGGQPALRASPPGGASAGSVVQLISKLHGRVSDADKLLRSLQRR